jgi:hypothetical protein
MNAALELPLTVGAPALDCPASSFFALDYRISSKGKRATGTNCVVGFTPAPAQISAVFQTSGRSCARHQAHAEGAQ